MSHTLNPYGRSAVRRSMATFLAGRGLSAILTFTAFALAARLLSLPHYGIYAAALALMEVGLALSTAGLDWVAARVLPEYRVHAGGRATVTLLLRIGALQATILLIAGGLVGGGANLFAGWLQIEGAAPAFQLAGVLLAVEGVGRLSRDQMLGILMHQASGQAAQLVRVGTLTLLLALALASGDAHDALDLLRFELIAASAAALTGALLLARALWRLWPLPAASPQWQAPSLRQMLHLGLHTYASYVLALAYGPQVLTMLIARLLGVEAVAIFGFARGFADQVRRYLPTDLLQSIFRPALVAYYSASLDFAGLMLRLGLWLKASLMLLLPLLAFFAVFGEQGAAALGGERFRAAWPVLLLLLCGAGMLAWRRVLELASYAVMAPDLCVRAGMLLVAVLPIVVAVLALTGSLLAAVAVVVVAEAGFCLRVLQLLRQRGFSYVQHRGEFMRLLLILVLSVALLWGLRSLFAPPLWAAAAITLGVCLLALRVLRPLSAPEDALVADWSPRLAQWAGCAAGAGR